MDFAAFIAPLGVERFMADHYGRRPVHIPASPESPRAIVGWARLNALLAIRAHWTEANINLVLNSRPVERDHYVDEVATLAGPARRADPAKVASLLSVGASLVANAVEEVDAGVGALVDMLADRFGGQAGANLYCSFKDVRAFASHYDTHEVFAVHCEGEKVWRIYRNRADAPIDPVLGDERAQQWIDAAKGEVMMEVRMRPGDLLYIPRGFFHDALASSAESLHLTLAVAPYSGRILFRLIEEAALREADFRHYLPDGRDGDRLAVRLDDLAERVAALMRSPAFLADVANAQRKLARPHRAVSLPDRPPVEAFARTDWLGTVQRRAEGAFLRIGAAEHPLGLLAEEAEWMLGRPAFVIQELLARYPHRGEEELRGLVALLARHDLVAAYRPSV